MGGPAEDGEYWTGSVAADRDWLTTDDPIKAMQHAYCPQVRRILNLEERGLLGSE